MRTTTTIDRRGAAMPLVLVSLGMATILTASYISARDNSALLGENAAVSSTARWSATAGVDLGIAILETEIDWRNLHTDGKLLDDFALDGALIDIDLIDLETGAPPTDETNEIELTATAMIDGLSQTVVAIAHVATDELDSVDVDLGEFAVYGDDEIDLNDNATVARWPRAPMSELGQRLAIGTGATAMGKVDLSGNAAAIDSTVYHGPGASSSLVMVESGPAIELIELLEAIPVPAPPSSGEAAPIGGQQAFDVIGSQTVAASDRFDSVTMATGSTLTFDGDITVVAEGNFTVGRGATLNITGNSTLVVFGNMLLNKGAIELQPDASLTMFLDGTLDVVNAYIGNDRPLLEDRDNTGEASWLDVQSLQMFAMPGGGGNWTLYMTSVVKASLYNPAYDITIDGYSAVYGRVLGKRVVMNSSAALFYDHALDDGNGFTSFDSLVFDDTNHIDPLILGLDSLDAADLETLSDDLGVNVKGGTVEAGDYGNEAVLPPSGPTPRPIPVDFQIVSYGLDVTSWE